MSKHLKMRNTTNNNRNINTEIVFDYCTVLDMQLHCCLLTDTCSDTCYVRPLQGAATWWIKWHDCCAAVCLFSMSHISQLHVIIIIITTTMFIVLSSWQSHCESSPGSSDECRTAPSGRRPKTKPDDLGCASACTGCQKLHPPSPFIIITQPESWYLFYRPTEGRRVSRPSWLVTYIDGLPVQTGSDVVQLHWSRPTRYH